MKLLPSMTNMQISRSGFNNLFKILSRPVSVQRRFSSQDDKPPGPVIPGAGTHRSTWNVLKEEFISLKQGKIVAESDSLKVPRESDILIIGGGLIGSSVAYWLKQRNPKAISVTIVERDPSVRILFSPFFYKALF